MKLIRPFGPIVAKVTIPKNIIDSLNKYVDEIINNANLAPGELNLKQQVK